MMASQTQTVRRPALQAERNHDYLYDHHYVLSSERDHARATFKAHTSTDRVKRVPVFKTMFSELRHHPRFQMRLDVTDPVPKFINRQWRGYSEQARDALVRYTKFNYDPTVSVPAKTHGQMDVSGTNRYKYFRRPIIPFLQQVPPDVLLASARQDPLAVAGGPDHIKERPPTPPFRTTMTQTDYRDSEAQTDPYTPEYVVRPGSQPELLTLATLSYGRGLPAGLAEVEMIERARAKRAWEATLPPLNDTSQLEKRRRMMDEMETKEWSLREQEIEKLQEARLEVLMRLLKQREEHNQELNTRRLDKLWGKKQAEKDSRVRIIRNEHIKAIRKLTKKRQAVEGKLERRDVVRDFSDYGSQVYAPLTRVGVFLDRGSEQFNVKSRYLSTFQGLLELEHSLPDFVTQPRIKGPKPQTVTKSGFTKRKYRQQKELADIHQVIKEEREKVSEPPKPLRFLQKIEKPVPRPPTPAVEVPSEEEEERELAAIFLQQVLRGRAVQNMMFEGKEKRRDLIQELRSTHALQGAEQQAKRQEKQATMALQRQRRLHEHKESFIDEALSQLEGGSLGDQLDFLSKELVRLQEERRIHAFSMMAERVRRVREAEESGRRQVEERRRREEDEVFKQVVKVHQDSVDTYLENIILLSVDHTADSQARLEIRELAEKINDVAYDVEETRTNLHSEEIVSELVHSFLLPEVQKQTMRDKVQRNQRKYLVAAHKEVYNTGEETIATAPKHVPQKVASRPATPQGSKQGSPQGSRQGTPQPQISQLGTPQGCRQGTPQPQGSPQPQSSRQGTPQGSHQGSRQGTPQGSVRGTPQGSRQGTPQPQGSRQGTPQPMEARGTPLGSNHVSPQGSKQPSPKGSHHGTPRGSKQATPQGSRQATPQGSRQATPQGSRQATPQGSRQATPQVSRQATPQTSPKGSKHGTPQGSRQGTPQPDASKSPEPQK